MGVRRTGSSGSRTSNLKERANMSFMLVVMFFAVFGVIVFTEIFLIDERHNNNVGSAVNHRYGHRLMGPDRPDYEEVNPEDYGGLKGNAEEQLGLLVAKGDESRLGSIGGNPAIVVDSRVLANLEARLPRLDVSLRLTHAEWLPITNTRYKFFVYSAYYDERASAGGFGTRTGSTAGVVRVIGATKTRGAERVWCRLWYLARGSNNATASITVAAKVKAIRENWNLKYSACFVICPLPREPPANTAERQPHSVSIVAKLSLPPTNRIRVQNRPADRPTEHEQLAICIKPIHYNYNRVLQLIEFIELHKILGVNHVTVYNDSMGKTVGCALRYYEDRGQVTLLPWRNLDMVSQKEIRTEGLFAALNDCLYRSMYKYDYLALLDFDEFIIPRHDDTIIDLIRWMGTRINPKTAGAYSFQNAFFYLQWPNDPYVSTSRKATEAALMTLRKTRRRSRLHPHKQRSKYVCRSRDVVEAGNHFVWEFTPGHGTVNVPADAAILHHYRVCEFGGDDCIKTASVVDRTAYKYLDKLADKVETVWQELLKQCPDMPELEPVPFESSKHQEALPPVPLEVQESAYRTR